MNPICNFLIYSLILLPIGCDAKFTGGGDKTFRSEKKGGNSSGDNEANPNGSGFGKNSGGTGPNGGIGFDNGTNGGGDGGIDTDSGTLAPQECNTSNIVIINKNSAAKQCPANAAAFAVDDAGDPRIACCPLPAGDILLSGAATVTEKTCPANHIATGISGGALVCTEINTNRYSLTPSKTCYYGSGSSGGQGTSSCKAPPATMEAMTPSFGSDSCLGSPYGSLITKRTSKYCRDTSAAQLMYDDGQPVPMFK